VKHRDTILGAVRWSHGVQVLGIVVGTAEMYRFPPLCDFDAPRISAPSGTSVSVYQPIDVDHEGFLPTINSLIASSTHAST
jgi:hypothetical protein